MENRDDLLIWWTSGADAAALFGPDGIRIDLYPYLARELRSRRGRAGRGRLWVSEGIEAGGMPPFVVFTVSSPSPAADLIAKNDMGGIVFRRSEYKWVAGLPGFVTDLNLRFATPHALGLL